MTRRGGGAEGACGRRAVAGSQASQCGLVVRPAKGVDSHWRFDGRGGSGGVVRRAMESLSHAHRSMTHSQRRAISTSWEKKRAGTMAKLPHITDIEQPYPGEI